MIDDDDDDDDDHGDDDDNDDDDDEINYVLFAKVFQCRDFVSIFSQFKIQIFRRKLFVIRYVLSLHLILAFDILL